MKELFRLWLVQVRHEHSFKHLMVVLVLAAKLMHLFRYEAVVEVGGVFDQLPGIAHFGNGCLYFGLRLVLDHAAVVGKEFLQFF